MTAPDAITIIFDDVLAVDFSKSVVAADPPNAVYPVAYNNTITVFDRLNTTDIEFMTLRVFDGSTVQLYGIAPPSQFNQTFIIERPPISPPREYSYHAPGYGGLHYTSTSPPNTSFSALVLAQAAGFALDYAVVTVYPTKELLGKTILVDDSSSSLIWRGSWTEENNFTLPIPCDLPFIPTSSQPQSVNFTHFTADIAPHANTTHASQTRGDEFEFWFTGTSISVQTRTRMRGNAKIADPFHDVFTPSKTNDDSTPWLLQMSFTLDAAEPIMVNITSQGFGGGLAQPHLLYFNASSIPAGNHSLIGRIVDVVGTTLPRARIDYITYKPSFASQADMPVLPPFLPTMTTSSTSPTWSSDANSSRSAKAKITSAAVGGAVGAIVLFGLAIVLLLYMRRRQRSPSLYQVDEPFSGSSASTSYILPVVEKRGTMRLGNDNASQELRTLAQDPAHAGPPVAENLSPPLVDMPAVHDLERPATAAPQGSTEIDSRLCKRAAENILDICATWSKLYGPKHAPPALFQVMFSAGTTDIHMLLALQATSSARIAHVALQTALSKAEECIGYLHEMGERRAHRRYIAVDFAGKAQPNYRAATRAKGRQSAYDGSGRYTAWK
ncbi:hypothetical protein C8F01DRAFT_1372251 [Mycena amicta]|nr:hypothetical protein C8F01DRAFT_1372251 [Mycena amicta]